MCDSAQNFLRQTVILETVGRCAKVIVHGVSVRTDKGSVD